MHGAWHVVAALRLPGFSNRLLPLWLPFGFLGVVSWSVWVLRRTLTGFYRPVANDHWQDASVVAPAYREDPEVLRAAVRSWLAAGAREVVLVLPRDELEHLAAARAMFGHEQAVRLLVNDDPDKRRMLAVGIREACNAIVVLADSDTLWEPDLLRNLVMPFADPSVGGVGTRQRVLDAGSSIWRRAAEWMLDAKYLTYLPAMSLQGGVSCLSGRTVAYRRELVLPVLDELVDERFLGRRCVSGDDGRLTWLVLNQGYRTVYQRNALAWTMMPNTFRGFVSQRVRWSRNSWRCYLRAILRGWLFRQPMITRLSVLQGLLAPFSLTVGFVFVGLAVARRDWLAVGVWWAWINCGRGIRAFDHLVRNPRHLALLPLMTVVFLFLMTGVKYFAFFTMNRQAWITRRDADDVAEGQAFETLDEPSQLAVAR